MSVAELTFELIRPGDFPAAETAAAGVHQVVAVAFGARPALDPPSTALSESVESIEAGLYAHGGVLARQGDEPVGALVFAAGDPHGRQVEGQERSGWDRLLRVTRFCVLPTAQGLGVARLLIDSAAQVATSRGYDGLVLVARVELPQTIAFWEHHGFTRVNAAGFDEPNEMDPAAASSVQMVRMTDLRLQARTVQETQQIGRRLAALLRPGDLVILTGDLGAGKTTFTQGLGEALEVRAGITSPTFVIARVHPALGSGPDLVHVDAYRLSGIDELDDLDLDTSLEEAVTVVEWGEGVAEGLSDDRLEIRIARGLAGENREFVVRPVGLRWLGAGLDNL